MLVDRLPRLAQLPLAIGYVQAADGQVLGVVGRVGITVTVHLIHPAVSSGLAAQLAAADGGPFASG